MDKRTRLNRIYAHMKSRCLNPKDNRYKQYGGRGITICDEWLDSAIVYRNCSKGWLNFKNWAFSHGYQEDLTIDRIDVNKGYSPDNCRWVTAREQCNNRRSNHLITYNGETKNLSEWCENLGLNYDIIERRINKCHWTVKEAFETEYKPSVKMIFYNGKEQSLTDWCKELGLNFYTIFARLNKLNWSVEKAFKTR